MRPEHDLRREIEDYPSILRRRKPVAADRLAR